MQYQVLTFMLLIFIVGCGTSTKPKPTKKTAKTASQTEKTEAKSVSLPPKYKSVVVKINNHKFGESNGCTTTFSPQPNYPNVNVKHGSTCGHEGAVSKLNWEYLNTDEQGDHYRFERSFPHDQPNQVVTTKEVIYQGKEIIIFEDYAQRISMFPLQVDKESNSN